MSLIKKQPAAVILCFHPSAGKDIGLPASNAVKAWCLLMWHAFASYREVTDAGLNGTLDPVSTLVNLQKL